MRTFIIIILLFVYSDRQLVATDKPEINVETNSSVQQTVTVGLKNADVVGSDNLAIQAAIDLLYFRGGGTVKILPGKYILYNSIYLKSNVNLIGNKDETILKRCPAVSSRLFVDADKGEKQITPSDPSLFRIGMGVSCRSNNLMNHMVNSPLTITRIEDGNLYVNDFIPYDFTADLDSHGKSGYDGLVANIFPMILGNQVENIIIDGLTINSFVDEDPGWENVRVGGIYFRTSKNSVIRNVHVSNTQGDGIFIDHASRDIIIEHCELAYNTYHGFHPGSHSSSITVRNCNIHHNGSDGIYICWGIKNSRFQNNKIHNNGIRKVDKRHGISIGHKDTHNIIEGNHIFENAIAGICFREKTEANGAHHNIIIDNIIENNGLPGHTDKGYGILMSGITRNIEIKNNIIRETRKGDSGLQKIGVYMMPGISRVQFIDNVITGHSEGNIVDLSE